MKTLMTIFLFSSPASAQMMPMQGGCGCGGCGGASGCVHLAAAIYAVLAALGYWVLQHASKEAQGFVKTVGRIVAFVLVVAGLLGFLCGVGSHIKSAASRKCHMNGMAAPDAGNMKGMPMMPNCPMNAEKGKAPAAK